jgi:hypothetical protein
VACLNVEIYKYKNVGDSMCKKIGVKLILCVKRYG